MSADRQLEAARARAALPFAGVRPTRTQVFLAAVGAEEGHLAFTHRVVRAGRPVSTGHVSTGHGSTGHVSNSHVSTAHVSRLSSARRTQTANCSPSARSPT